jgi:hypothetical protein
MVINQKNTAIKCYATYNLCLNFKHHKPITTFKVKAKKTVINPECFGRITDYIFQNKKLLFQNFQQ